MRKLLAILVLMVIGHSVEAITFSRFAGDIRQRRLDFNSARLPDTTIMEFLNQSANLVAVLAKTNQQDTTIELTQNALEVGLPARTFLIEAVNYIRQPDPSNQKAFSVVLNYVPIAQYGKNATNTKDYPSEFSFWKGAIKLNVPARYSGDSLELFYYTLPKVVDTVTDTVDIPDEFIPLLKEMVANMCEERIQLQSDRRADTEARLRFYEEKIFGRPADEK